MKKLARSNALARAVAARFATTAILSVIGLGFAGAARAQTITELPLPAYTYAVRITAGSDGALWFSESSNGGKIGRITTAGVVTDYSIAFNSDPVGIAAGPDNALWFTDNGLNKIGRITTAGVVTEYSIPTANCYPYYIAAGPDGNLWFTEYSTGKIGRITTAGVITEFVIPTAGSGPIGIVAGPDGALWFTESNPNQIGRITTAGIVTNEFPIPTANSFPNGIAAGSDGALWFAEFFGNKIGRITTAGVITEFPIPTGNSSPYFIAAGPSPDQNLWFTEYDGNKIGRITTAGVVTEFAIPSAGTTPGSIAPGPDGALWFIEGNYSQIGRITTGSGASAVPMALDLDSAGNGVFEPGESVVVSPSWKNVTASPLALTGLATGFIGPAGATYTITDNSASYGALATGVTADCTSATGDCYGLSVSPSASRPLHWDASFTESVSSGDVKTWTLHIGNSFADVPTSSNFYRFVETLLHNGVTAGCGNGDYCPVSNLTRAQMAVFLLRSKEGSSYTAPACTVPVFSDVPCSSYFAPWINELAVRGVTAGCGNGNFCGGDPVTRAQTAVFLLRTLDGISYTPPACTTPTFADVPCSSPFARWVNELAGRGIAAGCGNGDFCPNDPVTRGQMAVFLTATFGLKLYGP